MDRALNTQRMCTIDTPGYHGPLLRIASAMRSGH